MVKKPLAICVPRVIIALSPSPLFSCLKDVACAASLRRFCASFHARLLGTAGIELLSTATTTALVSTARNRFQCAVRLRLQRPDWLT